MATKPVLENIRWSTDESNVTPPSTAQRNTGWTPGQEGVSDYQNVLSLEAYRWAAFVDAMTAPRWRHVGPDHTGVTTSGAHFSPPASGTFRFRMNGLTVGERVTGARAYLFDSLQAGFTVKLFRYTAATQTPAQVGDTMTIAAGHPLYQLVTITGTINEVVAAGVYYYFEITFAPAGAGVAMLLEALVDLPSA